jgi:glutamyl-Q tRNA(Asp) synthetase
MKIERFAPSPTGLLHLGHAYSALLAYNSAIRSGGKFFIRIEDIDQIRCKKLFIEQILDDLKWLGINHEKPILKQSSRFKFYKKTLQSLWDNNYLFGL